MDQAKFKNDQWANTRNVFEKKGDFDQKSKFMRIGSNLPQIPDYSKNMKQMVQNNTLE